MKQLITIILIITLCGCGTRKAELDSQKVKTERLAKAVLEIQNNINSNVRMRKLATRKIVEPVDPTIPSSYNGQDFKNAKIIEEETSIDSTATSSDKSQTKIDAEESESSSEKRKIKSTESKRPNPWLWIGLLFVVGLIIWLKPWK